MKRMKTKKRSLNELRQVKEYYKPPVSHKVAKAKNKKVKFTKKELEVFSYNLVINLLGLDIPSLNKNTGQFDDYTYQLEKDLGKYIENYFNEK